MLLHGCRPLLVFVRVQLLGQKPLADVEPSSEEPAAGQLPGAAKLKDDETSGQHVATQLLAKAAARDANIKGKGEQHKTVLNAVSFYGQHGRKRSTACIETAANKQQGRAKRIKCPPARYLQ